MHVNDGSEALSVAHVKKLFRYASDVVSAVENMPVLHPDW